MSSKANKSKKRLAAETEGIKKRQKKAPSSGGNQEDLSQWRVVMTGEFRRKEGLEAVLKSRGVKVTGNVSGKTTHLILGETGRNDYDRVTGVGSKKHTDATERGLPILTEADIFQILETGNIAAVMTTVTEEAPKKPAKSAKLLDKIVYILHHQGRGAKLSLAKLKSEIAKEYEGMDFSKAQTKTSLKKALEKGVNEGHLSKEGASYLIASAAVAIPQAVLDAEDDPQYQQQKQESELHKLAPLLGRWRGLLVMSKQKSKSGRARCAACRALIAKGEIQVQVSDDSLFRMCVFPGDHHEGVSRGYVECGFPGGYDVVSRKKFNVHEGCLEAADDQYREKFQNDWANIRPHVLRLAEEHYL